jgi:hypothetical protein
MPATIPPATHETAHSEQHLPPMHTSPALRTSRGSVSGAIPAASPGTMARPQVPPRHANATVRATTAAPQAAARAG